MSPGRAKFSMISNFFFRLYFLYFASAFDASLLFLYLSVEHIPVIYFATISSAMTVTVLLAFAYQYFTYYRLSKQLENIQPQLLTAEDLEVPSDGMSDVSFHLDPLSTTETHGMAL